MRLIPVAGALILALVLVGCGAPSAASPTTTSVPSAAPVSVTIAPSSAPSPMPARTAAALVSASPEATCYRHPNGGDCLGLLGGGTYTTELFRPTLTYTVPSGWTNPEEEPGTFSLLPPGADFTGVDAGTSDYIGVYASIAADPTDCSGKPAPGVARTPAAIASALGKEPSLVTTSSLPSAVGGLTGLVLDIRLTPGWTGDPCKIGLPGVPILTGVGPSDFEHAMVPGLTMRLYLLALGPTTLAIELDDLSGGAHLDAYSAVVSTFKFAR